MKNFISLKFVVVIFIFSIFKTLSAQIVINKPSFVFTQACASSSFNSYNVDFSFSPVENLNPSNQFEVELSDATGDFSSA